MDVFGLVYLYSKFFTSVIFLVISILLLIFVSINIINEINKNKELKRLKSLNDSLEKVYNAPINKVRKSIREAEGK